MSEMSSLELGKRALLASRLGLDVTSNNIANVNTTGYSRRQVVFSETTPQNTGNGFLGTGVLVDKLRTFRQEYVDSEIRKTISRQAGYETDESTIKQVESVLGEPSDNGLNEVVTNFFNAFEDLSLSPESQTLRENLLSVSQSMVDRFHSTSQQLSDIRKDVYSNMNSDVTKANQLINEIAESNKAIASATSQTNSDPQTLIDQREVKIEELSKIMSVSVTQGNSGMVNIFVNGSNIITGEQPSKLRIEETVNSISGERTANIVKVDANNNILNTIPVQSGEIASYLKQYNVTLDDKDSSSGFSIAKKLDEFVNSIVSKVNSLTVGGYGMDDTSLLPPGRMFFEPSIGGATAATISLSDDVKDKPRDIPLSNAPGEPGNNSVALQISQLSTDSNFIENSTPSEYYSGFLAKIGNLGNEATNGKNTMSLVSEQLNSQRESVMGVNLDEEAINLIKFQKAFEAASRVINVTNEILTTLIAIGT